MESLSRTNRNVTQEPRAKRADQRARHRCGALGLAWLAVTLCTLAACGGGDDSSQDIASSATPSREQAFAVRAAAAAPERQATSPAVISTEQLFLWAQATYPQLFPDSPPIVSIDHQGHTYEVRAYANGNYLGVSEGQGYGLGPFTNGELVNFGPVSAFTPQVCERIGCGTSPYLQGTVNTAVTVGAPSPTSLARTATANQVVSASFSGTLGGAVTSLAGQAIYLVIEDPLGVFSPNGSLQVTPRGSGWGYDLTLSTNVLTRAGRFADRLTIYACLDAQCATRLGGTPVTITYDVSVKSGG